jgi:hypothetical protein
VREVGVAGRPSVFVRALTMDEGRKLQRITRTAKNPVRMRRAIVVLMSGQGQAVRDITSLLQVSEDYVRDVIHAFNDTRQLKYRELQLSQEPQLGSTSQQVSPSSASLASL